MPDLDGIDDALAAIVGSGWTEQVPALETPPPPPPEPTPAPEQRDAAPLAPTVPERRMLAVAPARRVRDEDQEPEPPNKAIMDVGLLADFVTGHRSAEDTAEAAGVTINELHSALATTLQQCDSRELAKAMGVQIAVTQLKAGAVFNALLADLVEDIRCGRAKADVKLELMKILKGIARLEPKEDKGAGSGTGFTLNINVGAGTPPVVIESK